MKASRITRVVRLLTTLQSGKNYTVEDLAEIFGKSRRTIFRDLKELQAIGVPYHYDPGNGGYQIDPEFFLPPIDLNLHEALSLLLVAHKARNQMQVPLGRSALLAALKIENNLPAKVRQYCNLSLQNISALPAQLSPTDCLDRVFMDLHEAIRKNQKVAMEYDSIYDGKVISTDLSPYHLLFSRRAWYVLGNSSIHKSVRTFKINRILRLNPLGQCYLEGEFDVDEHFGRAWSMIPEGRLYEVKLRFLPKVARNVAEVRWHSTQKSTWNDDGSVTIEFRVDGINEISWWVMGYGDQVEVLSPKALREKIVQTASNVLKLHEAK